MQNLWSCRCGHVVDIKLPTVIITPTDIESWHLAKNLYISPLYSSVKEATRFDRFADAGYIRVDHAKNIELKLFPLSQNKARNLHCAWDDMPTED